MTYFLLFIAPKIIDFVLSAICVVLILRVYKLEKRVSLLMRKFYTNQQIQETRKRTSFEISSY